MNVARIAALAAGLPVDVPAMTVNRFCSSGVQSIALIADRIATGAYDVGVAGGVETMSMIPMGGNKPSLNPSVVEQHARRSTRRWASPPRTSRASSASRAPIRTRSRCARTRAPPTAQKAGKLDAEIFAVKTQVFDAEGNVQDVTVAKDEYPRADTTLEKLATLKPAFDPTGSVTAGNSSPLTDGAARRRRHLRRARQAARRQAARLVPRLRRRRRAARDHGHRPGPGGAQGAQARRPQDRGHRSLRAQRGLRRAVALLRARARRRPARSSTSTAAPSRSAIRSASRARA